MHSYPQKCAFLHNSFCVKDVKKSPPRHLSPALHSWTTLHPLSYKKSLNVPHILYHIACIRHVSCFGRIANASPLTPASSRHSDTFGYCVLQMNQGGVWWRHVACLKKQLTPRGCVVKAVGALSSAVSCSPLPFPPSFVFVGVCALCLCAHVFTDVCVYVVYVTWVITFGDTWELNPDPQGAAAGDAHTEPLAGHGMLVRLPRLAVMSTLGLCNPLHGALPRKPVHCTKTFQCA
ncbi:hypothetical protein VOLCADRAFT_108413 [Volvox carteri f. nagariensis]|uniref:Uncharacterized protein n=1 Tax=Volvox carteri f. nagariensis TaxID=3068 RepID=D8UK19_VOLCA|nr:uncharacterized protein VOLCADRAFT_108413 [Volvox carteri f. nagariensis]EFJ39921.1 hypothetical protein VOLCADRAFT_108413 [Volvox carteri f. nagariensis]|eukprot:XP_002959002.1 hypothetical protein VOLCADRAFT_108413 [Volvox carteri f. nagariensis]